MAAESCELIAQILLDGGCPPLTLLHFYNNMAGDGGARALSTVLRACPNLVDLRYSATRAGMDGCLSIAQVTTIHIVRPIQYYTTYIDDFHVYIYYCRL